MPIRIVHVLEDLSERNSGVTSAVIELMRCRGQAVELQHEVLCVGDQHAAVPEDVRVTLCPAGPLASSWKYSPELRRRLPLATRQASVVHIHGAWMYPQLLAAKVAIEREVPFVFTPHNMLGGWLWKSHTIKRFKKTIYWSLLCGRAFRRAAVVHALSDDERRNLHRFFNDTRIEVIPNGIDAERVFNLALQSPLEKTFSSRFLLFLGRLHPAKGLLSLVRAIRSMPEESRLPLVVAGPSQDDSFTRELHQEIRSLGVEAWIRFLGPVHGTYKWALLRHAHAVVLPSFAEGISMVALEAMACGAPVITTRAAGIEDVNSAGGLLVNTDAESIAGALVGAAEWYKPERERRGELARQFVRANFDRKVVERRFEALYASLV